MKEKGAVEGKWKGVEVTKENGVIVVAIGLVIILGISVMMLNSNREMSKQSAQASDAINSMLLQKKDFIIKKLLKALKARQAELDSVKTQLAGANVTLNNIKTELNVPVK